MNILLGVEQMTTKQEFIERVGQSLVYLADEKFDDVWGTCTAHAELIWNNEVEALLAEQRKQVIQECLDIAQENYDKPNSFIVHTLMNLK